MLSQFAFATSDCLNYEVSVNGVMQVKGAGDDYVISGDNIVFNEPPKSAIEVVSTVEIGEADGAETSFTFNKCSLLALPGYTISVGGAVQQSGLVSYTVDATTGAINFTSGSMAGTPLTLTVHSVTTMLENAIRENGYVTIADGFHYAYDINYDGRIDRIDIEEIKKLWEENRNESLVMDISTSSTFKKGAWRLPSLNIFYTDHIKAYDINDRNKGVIFTDDHLDTDGVTYVSNQYQITDTWESGGTQSVSETSLKGSRKS